MENLFSIESLITLFMLILLQAVLGFDNLLYISLESQKAPKEKQSAVRKIGISLAIALRIVLLFVLMYLIQFFQDPFLKIDTKIFHLELNVHAVIVLVGGVFILYTAVKEIWHMMHIDPNDHHQNNGENKSAKSVIAWIVVMNLIFSFDSILSAMALTSHLPFSTQLILMTIAIVTGGLLMIFLADKISTFLQKNRMYEVLGLFVLLIVGIMLLSEGGHLAHISILDNHVTPMSKTTFYFVITVLVLIDIVQGKYQKKLLAKNNSKKQIVK
ncbi:TerC family protein [Wenyingzhuangia sp. IMCC45533]